MSTLDLVALLVALTVVLLLVVRVLSLRPRRVDPPIAAPPSQRTVADLVRMRAQQVVVATEEERPFAPRDVVEAVAEASKPRGETSPIPPAARWIAVPPPDRLDVLPPDRIDAESVPVREVPSFDLSSVVAPWRRVAWMTGADQPEPAAASGQPVRFRVRRQDGGVVAGAVLTLCDDRSRAAAAATADRDGCGDLHAPQRAGYLLIATAPGHQPSAVALTIDDAPIEVKVLLARSAGLSGTVHSENGPVPDARVLLIQGCDLVDTAHCDAAGAYRLKDLAAGEYCLSATATGCAPISMELQVAEGADIRHDVFLRPVADNELGGAGAENG